jgi:hypothetical protein
MSLIRYRPVIENKEAEMLMDVSGAWTSLTCYYTLHDKIVALQAENERLRKAGDAMYQAAVTDSTGLWVAEPFKSWLAAKGVQS